MPTIRRPLAVIALLGCLGASGCTLAKPLVGAVTGPVVLLANSTGGFCSCDDGRGIVVVLAIAAAVGAAGGLVTGIISDIQVLTGDAEEPCHNWWDPFKTNTDGGF